MAENLEFEKDSDVPFHEETTAGEDDPKSTGSDVTPEAPAIESGSDNDSGKKQAAWMFDCELSFQKLAVHCGIRIDSCWMFRLAEKLGVASWRIGMSIYNGHMDPEILGNIRALGYQDRDWGVRQTTMQSAISPCCNDSGVDLLKIAEEVLQSGTIHASCLALNILSLKSLISQESETAAMKGANAVNIFSEKRFMFG